MAHNNPNLIQATSPTRPPEDETLVSLQSFNNASLDDLEFQERHGEQYHLRHHLSGCAQTLYTIDFSNDFTAPSAIKFLPIPTVTAQADMTTISSSVAAASYTLLDATLVTSLSESAVQHLSTAGSETSESSLSNINTSTFSSDFASDHALRPALAISSLSPLETINAPEVAEIVHSLTSPLIANFNDGSLGGWTLSDGLTAEQVIDNGQLHLSADSLTDNQPLLSHSMTFVGDQNYQFQMNVQTATGEEPPRFVLNVNGVQHELEATREGEGYVLRVEFTAPHSGNAQMSLMPIGISPSTPDIWLDDVMVMPVTPPHEAALLMPEPIFDFSQLVIEPAQPTLHVEQKLDLTTMLKNIESEWFVDADAVQTHHVLPFNMELMMEQSDAIEPMTSQPVSELTSFYLEPVLLDSLEMSPANN